MPDSTDEHHGVPQGLEGQLKRSRLSQRLGVGREFHQVCVCLGSPKETSRPAIGFPGGRPWLHLSICKPPSDA
jgi:hypothetical protein